MSERRARRQLRFTLNGRPMELEVFDHELLLDVLRDRLGLTGAKRSCDMQICGTCTVLLDGAAISSCTTLVYEVSGREVVTIEGLADGPHLHSLQEAFITHGGLQCGFCTPGMILAATALLDENPTPSRDEIVAYLDGSICRCTGYHQIIESIESAASVAIGSPRRGGQP